MDINEIINTPNEDFIAKLISIGMDKFKIKELDEIAIKKYGIRLRGNKSERFNDLVKFCKKTLYIIEFRDNF